MRYGFPDNARGFPLMVIVNVSYLCNAKCIHCVHTLDPSSRDVVGKNYFISDAIFKKLADECGPHGRYIRVTGTGEPLLHPNILNLIKYAKEKGCKVSMITNGSLLDTKKADFLLDCGIDGVEFSVDAATKDTYEKIRRGLKFKKLLGNISYLKKQRDSRHYETNLLASFVEENANLHERGIAKAFWVPDYVDTLQFRVWLRYGKLSNAKDRRSLMKEREPCPYPFERINMDSVGDFHLCAYDINHRTNYGNIMARPVADIWRCEELDQLRNLLLERKFDEIPICSRCTDWGCRSWNHNFWKLEKKALRHRKSIKP